MTAIIMISWMSAVWLIWHVFKAVGYMVWYGIKYAMLIMWYMLKWSAIIVWKILVALCGVIMLYMQERSTRGTVQ